MIVNAASLAHTDWQSASHPLSQTEDRQASCLADKHANSKMDRQADVLTD